MSIEQHDGFEWHTQAFVPAEGQNPEETLNLAQRMFDYGLIWLVNRTLHPFGFALGVSVDKETQKVTGLNLHWSSDAQGVTFDESLDLAGRRKFYTALRTVFTRTLGW